MKQFKKIHVPDELAEHYEVAINPELQLQRAVTGLAIAFGTTVDARNPVRAIHKLTDFAKQVSDVFKSTNDRLEKLEPLLQQGSTLQQQAEFWKRDAEKARADTKHANDVVLRLKEFYRVRHGRGMDDDMKQFEREFPHIQPRWKSHE
jgi:hypothetical protein